ncbi:MAG: class I SAM-dependent methyltransferase [Pelosinus sp.]|nr:class I SAM-dependent methyltransferase [Pelosinus sp.]
MNFVVTTGQHATEIETIQAKKWAQTFEMPFASRKNQSLVAIKERYQATNVLIATKNGPVVHTPGGDFFFHLSMAELRIKNIINGKHDHMVAAMGLKPGMSVLDCTIGLGTDAIVASLAVGSGGRVVGLEASSLIAFITKEGLKNFAPKEAYISEALTRIQVQNIDYHGFLKALPVSSFDVVYFDPMFRQPIERSSNLKPMRYLADNRPLTVETLRCACLVAREKVIIKETHGSGEFERLGIDTIVGGKYSRISYGVIAIKDKAGID